MRLLQDLARARPGIRRYLLGAALMGAAHAVPWTLLPLYLDRLGFTKAEIGTVQAGEAWGRALVALPAAWLLSRVRTTPVLACTALLSSLAYASLAQTADLATVSLFNLARGLMDQVHYVALAPFVFRHTAIAERPTVFALSQAVHTLMAVLGSFLCGQAVGYLVAEHCSEVASMRWVLSFTAALPLLAAAVFLRIEEEVRDRTERAPLFATLRAHRGVVLRFALPQLTIATGAGLVIPFLGLYFTERFGFAESDVGSLYAAGQVLMTTGFLLTPWILRRLGFVGGIVSVELVSIPFFLVLAFTQDVTTAVFAFLLRGALMNTAHPIFKNFMMHASPAGLREVQTGVLGLLWGIGWILGPVVGGALIDAHGYEALMCVTVAMYVLASTTSWFLLSPLERGLPDAAEVRA